MVQQLTDDTPIAMLTVGQLREVLKVEEPINSKKEESDSKTKKYVYGIAGIARLFNCSSVTANRIKQSGKIDKAVTQVGRKIIVDAELALELAGKKEGGRK